MTGTVIVTVLIEQLATVQVATAVDDQAEVAITVPATAPAIIEAMAEVPTHLPFEALRGPKGDRGEPGAAVSHEHAQPLAAATWSITHGLDKFPAVSVVDTAGDLVLADIAFLSRNAIQIRFGHPVAGAAYLT